MKKINKVVLLIFILFFYRGVQYILWICSTNRSGCLWIRILHDRFWINFWSNM